MKKIFIIIVLLLALTGCTNINDLSYTEIANNFSYVGSKPNEYRTGYKYYIPRGMQVEDASLFNEILSDGQYLYYLYVDAVSYQKKVEFNYEKNSNSEFSASIKNDDKYGYIEVNLYENDKYLVEIMYNYAKIEVIVDKKDIKLSMISAISILRSIEYNDNIIANLLEDDVLNYAEEEMDIFNTNGNDNETVLIDPDDYKPVEEIVPDTDLIN
ncbi:MAG: membrane lipoprotein lipid attachment site-containing protein [Bacilli bacterium]